MTADEKRRHRDLLDIAEERRRQADNFAWAMPAVAVASQAFLLTIALNADSPASRRLVAAVAAAFILLPLAHLYWKQVFAFNLYEQVIKRERYALALFQVDRNSLLANVAEFDEAFKQQWMRRDGRGRLVRDATDTYFQPNWIIRRRAARVWLYTFIIFWAFDVALIAWSVWALLHGSNDHGGAGEHRRPHR